MKVIKILCASIAILSYSNSFAQSQQDLWDKLRNGGLVVLMGHTKSLTEQEFNASLIEIDIPCKKERPLSAQGRNEAVLMGKKFIKNKVPIEALFNSPYCRAIDTTKLAFKISNPVEFLRLWLPLSEEVADEYQEELVNKISNFSGEGNMVIITHGLNVNSISFETITNGTALIVKPTGAGEFEELGKIQTFL